MNKGERRRQRRRYRVRYDRIVIFALILTAVIVLMTSCVLAVTGKGEKPQKRAPEPKTSQSAQTTAPAKEKSTDDSGKEDATKENTTKAVTEKPAQAVDDGYIAETHTHDEIFMGDLILVNADHEYRFIDGDVELYSLVQNRNDYYSNGDYVTKLDSMALTKLNLMMEAFAKSRSLETTNIFVQDGYRTYQEQADRHSSGKSSTFEAGHCDYHTGRTFDMFIIREDGSTSYFSAEGDYSWFADNACKYGFIVRYPEGKDGATGEKARAYTYRYVGAPHATYMLDNGLCLEEYITEVKAHTKEDPLTVAVDGEVSLIYYVPASEEGDTDVPVPKDKEYTVSGNNSDGFIVTVKK